MKIRFFSLFFVFLLSYAYCDINVEDFNNSLVKEGDTSLESAQNTNESESDSTKDSKNTLMDANSMTNSAVKILNKNDIPWITLYPNVKKKIYKNNSQTLTLYAIKQVVYNKNNTFHFPTQEQDQVAFLIEGDGLLGFDKKINTIKGGSTFFIAGGKDFSFTTKTPNSYILVFTPNIAMASIDERKGLDQKSQSPEQSLQRIGNSLLSENEIKQFIYTWFVHFDKRDETSYFTNLLTGSIYKTTFSEPTVRSLDGFKKWYEKTVKKRVSHNNFSIDNIKIVPNPNGSVNVDFEVSWVAKISNGYLFKGAYEENWGLYVDENDKKIKISSYTVKQIR